MTQSLFGNIKNERSFDGGTLPFLTAGTPGRPNVYRLEIDLAKTFRSTQKNVDYFAMEYTVLEVLEDGGSVAQNENGDAEEQAARAATPVGTRCNILVSLQSQNGMGDVKAAMAAALALGVDDIDAGTMETAVAIYDSKGNLINAAERKRSITDTDGNQFDVAYEPEAIQGAVVTCKVYGKKMRKDPTRVFNKHVFAAAE